MTTTPRRATPVQRKHRRRLARISTARTDRCARPLRDVQCSARHLPGRRRGAGRADGGAVAGIIPDREIAVQLVAVSSLHGTVHGARGPSELFSVALEGPTPETSSFTDGAFEFPRVDPGDYTIEVTSSDGTGSASVHVASGESGSVDITLIANATVTGRLVDKSGKPIAGMSVAIIPDQPPGKLSIAVTAPPPSSAPDGTLSGRRPAWQEDAGRPR